MSSGLRENFNTLNFLCNLQMGPINMSAILQLAKKACQEKTL